MIDTHTHLQFKAFEENVDEVIESAKASGIEKIIVVGTNLETSKKAITLAEKHDNLYTSVGIHPHHVFKHCHPALDAGSRKYINEIISSLEKLINNPKVIAIGETGLDKHIYENTKYKNYEITDDFVKLQKFFFKEQIKLAIKHQKTLIIHNRQAVPELLEILNRNWDPFLEGRSVFHCCEPDQKLLDFATKNKVFIGIDGDITYDIKKQEFLKKIPTELLVLETDSPYFLPEPLRLRGGGNPIQNEPKNVKIIAEFISHLLDIKLNQLKSIATSNSIQLFNFPQM